MSSEKKKDFVFCREQRSLVPHSAGAAIGRALLAPTRCGKNAGGVLEILLAVIFANLYTKMEYALLWARFAEDRMGHENYDYAGAFIYEEI